MGSDLSLLEDSEASTVYGDRARLHCSEADRQITGSSARPIDLGRAAIVDLSTDTRGRYAVIPIRCDKPAAGPVAPICFYKTFRSQRDGGRGAEC